MVRQITCRTTSILPNGEHGWSTIPSRLQRRRPASCDWASSSPAAGWAAYGPGPHDAGRRARTSERVRRRSIPRPLPSPNTDPSLSRGRGIVPCAWRYTRLSIVGPETAPREGRFPRCVTRRCAGEAWAVRATLTRWPTQAPPPPVVTMIVSASAQRVNYPIRLKIAVLNQAADRASRVIDGPATRRPLTAPRPWRSLWTGCRGPGRATVPREMRCSNSTRGWANRSASCGCCAAGGTVPGGASHGAREQPPRHLWAVSMSWLARDVNCPNGLVPMRCSPAGSWSGCRMRQIVGRSWRAG